MTSWISPTFRFDQAVAPVTTWFPTTINYQGDPAIERRIAEEVASFGKQLGILSDAVLELADNATARGQLARLRAIVARVNEIKARQHTSLLDEATRAFESLADADPGKARRLLATLATVVTDAEDRKDA